MSEAERVHDDVVKFLTGLTLEEIRDQIVALREGGDQPVAVLVPPRTVKVFSLPIMYDERVTRAQVVALKGEDIEVQDDALPPPVPRDGASKAEEQYRSIVGDGDREDGGSDQHSEAALCDGGPSETDPYSVAASNPFQLER